MPEHILSGASLVDNRQVCSCGRVFYNKEEALHHLVSNPITSFDNAGRHISDIAREAVANADRAEGFASKAWEAAAFARLQQQLAKAARPHYKPKRKWYFLWLR